MHSLASSLKRLILLIGFATLLPKQVTSQIPTKPTYFVAGCYPTQSGNYTSNSNYYRNLNLVFSDLISHASGAKFYNSSAGISNDTTYGQYYCRGDISSQLCQDCVKAAVQASSEGGKCFLVKSSIVWYQECTLWYDEHSNVGVWSGTWSPAWWRSLNNVSDPTKFSQVFLSLVDKLIKKAAYGGDPLEFATGEDTVTPLETVYCLVQCSPDITGSNCDGCLADGKRYIANNYLAFGPDWVFLFYPNCQLRYSLKPFYPISSPPPPSSPPTSPPVLSPPFPIGAPPPPRSGKDAIKHNVTLIVVPVAAGAILLLCGVSFAIWFCLYRRKKNTPKPSDFQPNKEKEIYRREDSEIGNIECFGFRTIEEATMKFSLANKLGEGGFGSVYKGILPDGTLVAIKRLATISGQGIREFKTEVAVVAKLQHRNLVRLVGYCAENEERILVYEYMSNLSLDKSLFDASKSSKLNWRTRYKIIEGIASGLRYLHIDSLLTIVHRDLKSSNILLDEEMNPKIADFGMARLVKLDQTTGNTSRIGGTYGYMAPEYAMAGRFSMKSDIYSFGIVILEILSGKSIGQFYNSVNGEGLNVDYAWSIWNDRAIERLVDPALQHNYSKAEAERCLQIALLCVQDESTTRPPIRIVVGLLENQSLELPSPSATSNFFRSPHTSIHSSETQGGHAQYSEVGFHDPSSNIHFDDLRPR